MTLFTGGAARRPWNVATSPVRKNRLRMSDWQCLEMPPVSFLFFPVKRGTFARHCTQSKARTWATAPSFHTPTLSHTLGSIWIPCAFLTHTLGSIWIPCG